MAENFTEQYYNIVGEAITSIKSKLNKISPIDIYDTENTLYETVLSNKYEGIYSIYELVEVYKDGDKYYVKGANTVDKTETSFEIIDTEPTTICAIADRI